MSLFTAKGIGRRLTAARRACGGAGSRTWKGPKHNRTRLSDPATCINRGGSGCILFGQVAAFRPAARAITPYRTCLPALGSLLGYAQAARAPCTPGLKTGGKGPALARFGDLGGSKPKESYNY
jgi:hypothetical protein